MESIVGGASRKESPEIAVAADEQIGPVLTAHSTRS